MGARATAAVLQRGPAAAGAHRRLPRQPRCMEPPGASGLVASADFQDGDFMVLWGCLMVISWCFLLFQWDLMEFNDDLTFFLMGFHGEE